MRIYCIRKRNTHTSETQNSIRRHKSRMKKANKNETFIVLRKQHNSAEENEGKQKRKYAVCCCHRARCTVPILTIITLVRDLLSCTVSRACIKATKIWFPRIYHSFRNIFMIFMPLHTAQPLCISDVRIKIEMPLKQFGQPIAIHTQFTSLNM